jgi:hypothetical protein
MFEVIAKINNLSGDLTQITIRKDNQEMILGAEDANMLFNVLRGKKGVMSVFKKGEYRAHEVTLFSCEKIFQFSTTEE